MNHLVFDYINQFSLLEDIESLKNCFDQAIQQFGFSSYTYGGVRLPTVGNSDTVILTTYDEKWEKRYVEKGFQEKDPVVIKGLTSNLPFKWHDVAHDDSQIIREGKEFGHGVGLSIPIHGHAGELALLSLSTDETAQELSKLEKETLPQIHFLAFHYHRRVAEILSVDEDVHIHLSKREKETLSWTAKGKTAWEIGEILNISERTVNQYIQSANKKLGVFNKQHAVVKAIIKGLIIP